MKKVLIPLVAVLLPLVFTISTQAQRLTCTTHSRTNEVLENSPEARALREQLQEEIREYIASGEVERSGGVRIIPAVIHVIHDNGSENLSKELLLNAMETVNEELRAQNPNLSSVVSPFDNIIGDPQYEIRLAKIDPNGNCTDGITRTVSDMTYSGGENVKELINWNTGSRRYLQMWTVNTVGSGSGGYTYLPGTVNAQRNGIIIRSAQFQGTVTHEFGHWMNLAHTWGPTNENAVQSNCSFDDGISDTPNTIGTQSGCNTSQTSCGSLDNVQNHMDYSSCARMFTSEQASVMIAAGASGVGGRNYYWSAENLEATGTSNGFVEPPCVPEVEFSFDESLGCEGLEVTFDDNLWGANEDPTWEWNWTFPGGTPASSTDPNPTIVYNEAGVYDVTLTITTAAGSDSQTVNDAITVTQLGGGIANQYQEGMENSDFPSNSNPAFEWSVESPGGLTWQRNTTAAYSGSASARINLRSITSGDINSLISPPIDMSNVDAADAKLAFRLAHANRNSTNHDERLRVYASRNCGETWTLRYTEEGDELNTAGGLVSSTFVPEADDWRFEEVSLATMAGEEHVLIRFEARSDRQSYLYIDDININPSYVGINEIESLSSAKVYPNPIDGTSTLELNVNESDDYVFTLYNVVGKRMASISRNMQPGLNRVSIDSFSNNLDAGFYLIQITTDSGQKSVRFVKQ